MSTPEETTFDHDYDGIKEHDNPLPRWWVWLFLCTIGYAAVYMPWHHLRPGQLPRDLYDADMLAWNELHPPTPLPDEDTLVALEQEPGIVEHGREVFSTRCVACHGPDGGGQVGPNLTDDYTIHGWSRATIVKVVHDGVPSKGMIAWGPQLPREDVVAVALFVYGLRGTRPSTPKAPQGEPIASSHGSP